MFDYLGFECGEMLCFHASNPINTGEHGQVRNRRRKWADGHNQALLLNAGEIGMVWSSVRHAISRVENVGIDYGGITVGATSSLVELYMVLHLVYLA